MLKWRTSPADRTLNEALVGEANQRCLGAATQHVHDPVLGHSDVIANVGEDPPLKVSQLGKIGAVSSSSRQIVGSLADSASRRKHRHGGFK